MRSFAIRVGAPPPPARKQREMRFTETEMRRAVRAIENGESWRSVASRYEVATGTLTRWRRRYGDRCKPTNWTVSHSAETKQRAVRRVRRGENLTEVAKSVGCHPDTLRKWLRGLQLRDPTQYRFPRAFKLKAVRMLKRGWPITALARELKVSGTSLRAWHTQFGHRVRA